MSTVLDPPATGTESIAVSNPHTGEHLYDIKDVSVEEVGKIYARAREVHEQIAAMTVAQRIAEMVKLKNYILDNRESIIDRICSETGKSRTDALISEIFSTLDTIQYYEHNAEKHLAPVKAPTPIIMMPKKSKIFFEPMGPILIISPWNYPFNLTLTPFIGAFLAGNSVVFKPSEYTPLQGMLEEMFEKSGFIKDAMQIVYGGKETGARLIDGRPAKVFFTGSCRGGRQVMKHAAEYLIPVELELGGKDPMVVFDDVNIDRTVNGALWGGMTNCGQTCTAVERVIVHDKIYDEFVKSLKSKVENMIIHSRQSEANPYEVDMGVLTTDFQIDQVQEMVQDAVANGAEVLSGGKRIGDSQEMEPTVIVNVTPDMRIVREETFGPVITVQKFSQEQEAIDMANDTPYGLSASVWSKDTERGERVARKIVTGNVSVNNVLATQGNSALPFGGTKESGFGRYKGSFGLHGFCNVKSVLIDQQSDQLELNWYPYNKEKYDLFSSLIDAVFRNGTIAGLLKAAPIGGKLKKLSKKRHL